MVYRKSEKRAVGVNYMKIKEGSRVCCLGDSLTEMGFWIYDINGYLADIGSKTRFTTAESAEICHLTHRIIWKMRF